MPATDWALLVDLPAQGRRLISAEGPDAVRFLQGLLSQDVSALKVGEASAATLLTIKGKICWDAIVLRHGEAKFELAVPTPQAEAAHEKLDRHLIMDEVELGRPDAVLCVLPEVGPAGLGVELPEGWQAFETNYPMQGTLLRGPQGSVPIFLGEEARMDPDTYTRRRVRAGTPAWGYEVTEGRFPPEVGLVRAVSYDKGCFMGQEPLARIHARGQTQWVLARLESEATLPACEPGASIDLRHESRDDAGVCTSWVEGEGGALAVLRRKCADVGMTLLGADGQVFRVAEAPLGDDPGNTGNQARRTAAVSLGGR